MSNAAPLFTNELTESVLIGISLLEAVQNRDENMINDVMSMYSDRELTRSLLLASTHVLSRISESNDEGYVREMMTASRDYILQQNLTIKE